MLADDAETGLALLQRARAAGLGSLTVLTRAPQELVAEYPVVPLAELLDAASPSVTPEGFGYDPVRGELWFAGETAEAVLLELHGRRSALAAEERELDERVGAAAVAVDAAAGRAKTAEAAFGGVPRKRGGRRSTGGSWRRSGGSRKGWTPASGRRRMLQGASRRRCARASTPERRGRAPRERSCGRSVPRRSSFGTQLEDAGTRLTAAEVELARIEAEASDATRRLEAAGEVEPAEGEDRDELVGARGATRSAGA